jgi:hypothetical protein
MSPTVICPTLWDPTFSQSFEIDYIQVPNFIFLAKNERLKLLFNKFHRWLLNRKLPN